jgi:hypothetical protein
MISNEDENDVTINGNDLTEEDIGKIITIIATDGYYKQAQIVKVVCPACAEEFLGTKMNAGGFIAGHRAYHDFEDSFDEIVDSLGGV